MVRTTKSLKIDNDVWIKFKIHCIKSNKPLCDLLEEIIKKEIDKPIQQKT